MSAISEYHPLSAPVQYFIFICFPFLFFGSPAPAPASTPLLLAAELLAFAPVQVRYGQPIDDTGCTSWGPDSSSGAGVLNFTVKSDVSVTFRVATSAYCAARSNRSAARYGAPSVEVAVPTCSYSDMEPSETPSGQRITWAKGMQTVIIPKVCSFGLSYFHVRLKRHVVEIGYTRWIWWPPPKEVVFRSANSSSELMSWPRLVIPTGYVSR